MDAPTVLPEVLRWNRERRIVLASPDHRDPIAWSPSETTPIHGYLSRPYRDLVEGKGIPNPGYAVKVSDRVREPLRYRASRSTILALQRVDSLAPTGNSSSPLHHPRTAALISTASPRLWNSGGVRNVRDLFLRGHHRSIPNMGNRHRNIGSPFRCGAGTSARRCVHKAASRQGSHRCTTCRRNWSSQSSRTGARKPVIRG